tara:strand:+ start:522 stop:1343 length:822 start_codon:yes stop_codon:yes gene_type:complete
MRILIFGGTGYIGSRLASFLVSKKYEVGNVSRKVSKISGVKNFSINDDLQFVLNSFMPNKIIYLSACFNNEDINEIVNVNINIPLNILKIIEHMEDVEFIYTGSYWQFGDKSTPHVPIDLYSASKKAVLPFLDYYNNYTKIRCKEIVLYGTYGESDGRGKLLDYLLNSALSNELVELTEGNQKLNLVSIRDICKAIESIILTKDAVKFAIKSSEEYSPRRIVELIRKHTTLDVNFGIKPYRKVELMSPIYPDSYRIITIQDSLPLYIRNRLNK